MTGSARVLGSEAPVDVAVVRVAPAVDPATLLGLVRLRIVATNAGDVAQIKVGTSAIARVAIAKRQGLLVPAAALRRSLVGADEVVTCDHGKAHVKTVVVGNRTENGVEIKAGLESGDQIVIDHALGLEDEQPLEAGSAKGSSDK
jgi:hypothetical protein